MTDCYNYRKDHAWVDATSEMTASADLLRKGIPVYRALTFVSAADLVIVVNEKMLRVEVRSARRNKQGKLTYSALFTTGLFDVLALVESDGTVTYKPDIFAK